MMSMSSATRSPLSPGPFASLNSAPGLTRLHSGGVPAPIPVLVPPEGPGTAVIGDSQTLRTPIPLVPSSVFVGEPSMVGGEPHDLAPVDVNAVTEHIKSRSSNFELQPPAPGRAPNRMPQPPPPPPTPSQGARTESPYHTEAAPYTREANATEISTILQAPSRLLGHKFSPSRGREIWEVVEVSAGQTRVRPDAITAEDDAHRPAVPLRLQSPAIVEEKRQEPHGSKHKQQWRKEPDHEPDAFALKDGEEEDEPIPQLVGTGEVVVRFRGYERSGEDHYMLVRDLVDMLRDRTVLIVEVD